MIPQILAIFTLAATNVSADTCIPLKDFASDGVLPQLNQEPGDCSTSRELGGTQSQDCFWSFELRSPEAQAKYVHLADQLRSCSEKPVEDSDTTVNHPDSFDQITGVVRGTQVSLSLKDKGGLGRTLIVLRRSLP